MYGNDESGDGRGGENTSNQGRWGERLLNRCSFPSFSLLAGAFGNKYLKEEREEGGQDKGPRERPFFPLFSVLIECHLRYKNLFF